MGRVELTTTDRRPFASGHVFAGGGACERLDIRAHFAANPDQERRRGVYDVDLAPRDEDGLVRFWADLFILQPLDPECTNGACLFELPNRGNKRCLQFLNDAPATNDPHRLEDAGNGYLMRAGYTVMCQAWQGDVLPGDGRLVCGLPVAEDAGGGRVTARVRAEFIAEAPGIVCLPLSGKWGTRSHPAVSLDTGTAELRRRRYPDSAAEMIPAGAWSFARLERDLSAAGGSGDIVAGETAIVPSASHIYLPAGFEPGWIYELVYTACDPLVLDLGFVGIRDLVSALRHGEIAGDPPVLSPRDRPMRFLAWGRSQAGRAIRDFIYRGFNADAEGRRVFDGMITHIAGAGRTSTNRFSNLVVAASRQYEDHLNPADRFPFSYATTTNHLTGVRDSILKRPGTDPLIIHTQTASEYWHRRGSLVHTDTTGRDLAQPDTVRVYLWSSSQHWADPAHKQPSKGICTNYQNIVATSALFRAVLELMDAWVKDGAAPPPSRVPSRADGTLVPIEDWRGGFPAIPGVATPLSPNRLAVIDYGEAFADGGPAAEPPEVDATREYAVLVPAVDADGNDIAGVRAPMVAAPLGTYTGWNLRARGRGAGALHDFSGSYIPFPETPEERRMTGDPRPAILERYASAEA